METGFTEGKTFNKIDLTKSPMPKGEYADCVFTNCDFSGSDLADIKLMECRFETCNMSLAKLNRTALRDIKFTSCKILGLQFENCIEPGLSADFDNCILNHSSFYRVKLIKSSFRNCVLQEADFTESDLSGSVFENCDLTRAVFYDSILIKTDFRSSINYSIDPEKNRIKKAMFSLSGLPGLLDKYNIEIDFKN